MSYAVGTMQGFENGTSSIGDEVYVEIKEQLTRKMMTYLPIPIDPAVAIGMYANSLDAVQRIHTAHTNSDGSDNRNPNNFGNVYEEQEVAQFNHDRIAEKSPIRAERTDNLADMSAAGTVLKGDLAKYAVKHHEHVDIVYYNENTGEVIETIQAKHVRGSNILAKERYTTAEEAPDSIIVPNDMEGRHAEKLESIAERAHSEENRANAAVAREKLRGGLIDSVHTENPDKDAHPHLHEFAKNNSNAAKAIPYIREGAVVTQDAMMRVGGRLAVDCAAILVGGVLYEIRDAAICKNSVPFKTRLKRLVSIAFQTIHDTIKERALKELALEAVNALLGIIAKVFKNIASVVKIIAGGIHQAWEKICDFRKGKIRNYADLIAALLKVFSTVAITSVAIMAEEYLTKQFPWIPDIVAGILSAGVAGIAIVFANKAIDYAVGVVFSFFMEAEKAKIHREKVESYIKENFSRLVNDSDEIDKRIEAYIRTREELHDKTFNEVRRAFYLDSVVFRKKINEHADALGIPRIDKEYIASLPEEIVRCPAFMGNMHTV